MSEERKKDFIIVGAILAFFFIAFGYGYKVGTEAGVRKDQTAKVTVYREWSFNNYVKGNTSYKTPYYLDRMLEEIEND